MNFARLDGSRLPKTLQNTDFDNFIQKKLKEWFIYGTWKIEFYTENEQKKLKISKTRKKNIW